MTRRKVHLLVVFFLLFPFLLTAQHSHSTPATPKKMSDADKIANAMAAAPAEIAKHATIMDWPATKDGKPRQLKAGTNGWVCYPNSPEEYGAASVDDPMCLDKEWQAWAGAWQSKQAPKVS